MSNIRSYRDLKIWQKGIEPMKMVYALTHKFPKHETYALASQLRRSSVSVPSNIAEGQARQHTGEFRRFLYIALGSAAEVDTQIVIAHGLGYITEKEVANVNGIVTEIRKMTHTLVARLPQR